MGYYIGQARFRPERRGALLATGLGLAMLLHGLYDSPLLMLQFAFHNGVRRVELLTDLRNSRSQAAIAKLGAVREGVLRRDRITWTGHVRDSVLFSITDIDWPEVKVNLESRLS